MRNLSNNFYFLILITFIITLSISYGQSNNNSYVFDGEAGYAEILDDDPVTTDANQTAYQYFDNPAFSNDNISVEAWVYLIGENPGVKMPIVYRAFTNCYRIYVRMCCWGYRLGIFGRRSSKSLNGARPR